MTKEELADKLMEILYPIPVKEENGLYIDHSVCAIEGALYDIHFAGGKCDLICMNTLSRVANKLKEAEKLVHEFRGGRLPKL